MLVTGAARFIGSHFVDRFLALGREVVSVNCCTGNFAKCRRERRRARRLPRRGPRIYPENIPRLAEPILAGRADYVLGSRFRGGVRGMKLYRRIGNYAFTLLLVRLIRRYMSDGQTGFRAFSREAAAAAEIIHDHNYAQVLTLDLLRKGFALEEVPIRYRIREYGDSFVSWRYPARVLPAIWRELRAPLHPYSTSREFS